MPLARILVTKKNDVQLSAGLRFLNEKINLGSFKNHYES